MPTTVRFASEALAATSLKERSAVVVGSKASLSAAGVYDLCRYAARALQHGERAVALRGEPAPEPAGTDLLSWRRWAISPAGEVTQASFTECVAALDADSPDSVALVGKCASLACLPARCSR